MKFGIAEKDYSLLSEIVLQVLKKAGAEVFLFGSRTKDDFHPFSDVDLLIRIEGELPLSFLSQIKENIENSNFPYSVDLVLESQLADSYKSTVYSQITPI